MKKYISYYKFFDINLVLETNEEEIQNQFRQIYGYFARDYLTNENVHCVLNKNGKYFLKATSNHYHMEYTIPGAINTDAYFSLFNPVIFDTKKFFLIHSGNLATKDKKSIIIAAPCGFGKTTMTRELLKVGFHFLSDELAPLELSSGLIHPFPRGMGVIKNGHKTIVDYPKNIPGACRPGYVIFLSLHQEDKELSQTKEEYLEIALSRITAKIKEELEQIPGVTGITVLTNRMFPMLRIKKTLTSLIVPEIQRICIQNQVPIMYTLKGKTQPADFNAPPQLNELSVRAGAFELMQHILNAHNSALLETTFAGSRPQLVFELAGLMNATKFYTLTIGKLPKMVNLVKQLCS